ncbi:MAG: tryptophan--tRNA ligase [Bdellovibrionota bacterium]
MAPRVLSGMRPTGPLHIGHWEGVLKNWVALQKESECFFFAADWHVLTTDYERAKDVKETVRENVADWIATGVDPEKSTLFVQSEVKEHAELFLLLGMLVPIPWLERNPTYKEQLNELRKVHISPPLLEKISKELAAKGKKDLAIRLSTVVGEEAPPEALQGVMEEVKPFLSEEVFTRLKDAATARDLSTLGFLGYPVLQTADIVIYKAGRVPVGEDQLPHIELSREIVRRFNSLYGNALVEPQALLTPTPRLLGTDDRKMSKSYGNAVFLGDSAEETEAKLKPMKTDPARKRRTDPGDPDKCNVFSWHRVYSSPEEQEDCAKKCRTAAFGCLDCKMVLVHNLNRTLAPVREKRAELLSAPKRIDEILGDGAVRARRIAGETLKEVRRAMKLDG